MKKNKNNISGWIVLDKPAGLSSTQALGRVRWLLNAAKGGHGGTLDPFATGVLPLAFGEATKLVANVLGGTKTYRFTVRWGEARNTDDLTGTVSKTSDARPGAAAIAALLPRFIGAIEQIPPQFSALHVDGARAYDLARAGETVTLAARQVTITRFDVVENASLDETSFEVDCSKGTYVRSLARDMGEALGCYGHVSALKRLASGPFTISQAISLEKLEEIVQKDGGLSDDKPWLLPLIAVLDDIPAFAVNENEARRLRQGSPVVVHPLRINEPHRQAELIAAADTRDLVALARIELNTLYPVRVFNVTNR